MRVSILLTAIALVACATPASGQDITYDYDRRADFSAFKTYAWAPGAEADDQLTHARIVAAIDRQLAAKGLMLVGPDDKPDLLVAYHAGAERHQRLTFVGWGGPHFAAPRNGTAAVDYVWSGTLAVEMLDTARNAVAWHGAASGEIDAKASPEKRDKNISRAVEKLFKRYPPR